MASIFKKPSIMTWCHILTDLFSRYCTTWSVLHRSATYKAAAGIPLVGLANSTHFSRMISTRSWCGLRRTMSITHPAASLCLLIPPILREVSLANAYTASRTPHFNRPACGKKEKEAKPLVSLTKRSAPVVHASASLSTCGLHTWPTCGRLRVSVPIPPRQSLASKFLADVGPGRCPREPPHPQV